MATKRMIEPFKLIEEITAMKVIDPHKKKRGLIERWVRNNGYDILLLTVKHFPTVEAVEVGEYIELREQYDRIYLEHHELRDNFISYVCSGIPNPSPFCLNKCSGCCDSYGWCKNDDKCKGFNPAEVILDGERKDNETG